MSSTLNKISQSQMIVVLVAVLSAIGFGYYLYRSPSERLFKQEGSPVRWTCAMHSQVVRYEAGSCPVCGMPLVRASGDLHSSPDRTDWRASQQHSPPLVGQVILNPEDVRRLGIDTQAVESRSLVREIEAEGKIEPNETRLFRVAAYVTGRVEQMDVASTGQTVSQGDPLYSIYSPSLVSAQEEYLLALVNRRKVQPSPYAEVQRNAEELAEAGRQRLLLWGLTENQIGKLEQTGQAQQQITFHAPTNGTVLVKHVVEGTYVEQGAPIYTLADLSSVWMIARVPEVDIAWIKLGQPAQATTFSYPGESFSGKVAFIDPVVDPETRTIGVRTEISNVHRKLKPEMFGRLKIRSTPYSATMAVPVSAIISSSPLPVVYVARGNGLFEARPVKTGFQTLEYAAIVSGLENGEQVVVNGNFFIDSQRQIRRGSSVHWEGSKEVEPPTRPRTP